MVIILKHHLQRQPRTVLVIDDQERALTPGQEGRVGGRRDCGCGAGRHLNKHLAYDSRNANGSTGGDKQKTTANRAKTLELRRQSFRWAARQKVICQYGQRELLGRAMIGRWAKKKRLRVLVETAALLLVAVALCGCETISFYRQAMMGEYQ